MQSGGRSGEVGPPRDEASPSKPPAAATTRFGFLDFLLPPETARGDDEALLRARILMLAGLAGAIAGATAILVSPEAPLSHIRWTSWALLAIFVSVPLLIRGGFGLARTRDLLMLGMCSYSAQLAYQTGGRDTGALFVAMLVPLVATLIGGLRTGLFWSLALAATLCAIGAAAALGFDAPARPDPEAVARWNLWAGAIGVVLSLAIAAAYEVLRGRLERRLREEKALADRLRARQHAADRRFQTELHALVEERTRALEASQRELRHAERLASIGTLAAGIAHQINNPVGGILLGAQVALEREPGPGRDAEWQETFRQIERDALRCARITRALLRFSASDTAEKRPIDLGFVVGLALESLRGVLASRDFARLVHERPAVALPVVGSEIELEQVVVNLVQNAVEATRDTQHADSPIRIACDRVGSSVRLRVEDAGPGVPLGLQTRIFDPFYTSRGREGGTGLGLSIVHGIVTSHGGSIQLASEPGAGARFDVLLPLAAEDASAARSSGGAGAAEPPQSRASATQRSGSATGRSAVASRPWQRKQLPASELAGK